MFAVVKCQGHQFIVRAKDKISVGNLEAKEGEKYQISKVLLVQPDSGEAHIGTPLVAGAHVEAKVLRHYRGKKIEVFKMKAKKRYSVKAGHRDDLTELLIEDIKMGAGGSGSAGAAGKSAAKKEVVQKTDVESDAGKGAVETADVESDAEKGAVETADVESDAEKGAVETADEKKITAEQGVSKEAGEEAAAEKEASKKGAEQMTLDGSVAEEAEKKPARWPKKAGGKKE